MHTLSAEAGRGLDGAIRGNEASEFVGWNGATEVIALILVAPDFTEEAQLLRGLHAFGNHFQVQVMAERHDGAHDLGAARVGAEVLDERAVDLELGERQAAQVTEARVARTEVIE